MASLIKSIQDNLGTTASPTILADGSVSISLTPPTTSISLTLPNGTTVVSGDIINVYHHGELINYMFLISHWNSTTIFGSTPECGQDVTKSFAMFDYKPFPYTYEVIKSQVAPLIDPISLKTFLFELKKYFRFNPIYADTALLEVFSNSRFGCEYFKCSGTYAGKPVSFELKLAPNATKTKAQFQLHSSLKPLPKLFERKLSYALSIELMLK